MYKARGLFERETHIYYYESYLALPYFCLPVIKCQQCIASSLTFPLSKRCFPKHSALLWNNSLGLPSCCGCLVRMCYFNVRVSLLSTSLDKIHCVRPSLFLKVGMKPRERNVSLYFSLMTIELSEFMASLTTFDDSWRVRIPSHWLTAHHLLLNYSAAVGSRSDLQLKLQKKKIR